MKSETSRSDMSTSVNLVILIEQFGSEDRYRENLEALRWPDEIRCPRCDSGKISQIVKRNQFDCDGCRYQFSVTAGTVFNDSHLPLWMWFLCVYLLCESKKGMSANQLKRNSRNLLQDGLVPLPQHPCCHEGSQP